MKLAIAGAGGRMGRALLEAAAADRPSKWSWRMTSPAWATGPAP